MNSEYEILNFSLGSTKVGTKMGKMAIKNLTDGSTVQCVLWEEAVNRLGLKKFKIGNIIKLKTATFNKDFNNCNVVSFDVIKEEKVGLDESEYNELFANLIKTVEEFKDEKLKDFVKGELLKHEDKFKTMPAAKAMHHNYFGGLLVHTTECVEFAKLLYPKLLNCITEDELVAACILHDFGKIFEYTMDSEMGTIEYNEQFAKDWISHSQYGFTLCMSAGFPNIAKMIASHHGRAEWGAIIDLNEKNLEPFYYLVHHIDDLSAKFGKITVKDI